MNSVLRFIQGIPPSQWCEAYFVVLGSGCLALQVMPADLRDALLGYGARRASGNVDKSKTPPAETQTRSWLVDVLDKLYILHEVPHAWFSHFYIVSLASLLFWAGQFLLEGRVIQTIAEAEVRRNPGLETYSMDAVRLVAVWGMLVFQAGRRAWECFFVMKPSRSPMLVIHWVMTMVFYLGMSVSFWIHGSAIIIPSDLASSFDGGSYDPFRLFFLCSGFYAASMAQSVCHLRLATLKKYSLPREGLFKHIVCPHYTMECIIYLVLALAAAPRGQTLNRTMAASLFFVATNLGVTARGTQAWYAEKFGADKVPRWKMIPLIF